MDEAPVPEPSDARLVARAKAGDGDAFGQLYRRYIDSIYRYLYVRVGNAQDAEDLTEIVFLRSFQALGRYRERGWAFSAFLYQVAKNVLVDHYRQQRTEAELHASEAMATALRPLDDHVIQDERLRALRRALDDLPPDYREVITLRVVLALPTPLVARWMARTEGATRVLLYRALEAVRRRLGERHEE